MCLTKKKKCHSYENIVGIKICCNHSCYDRSYFCHLQKVSGIWYYSALFNNSDDSLKSDIEDVKISSTDADNILSVCKKAGLLKKIRKHDPVSPRNIDTCDEVEYSIHIRYSDHTCDLHKKAPDKKIIDIFSALTEKYK